MTKCLYVGVDLGGTNVRAGVVDAYGNVLSRDKRKTLARESAEAPVRQISDSITAALSLSGHTVSNIGGIGIGSPGPLNSKLGKILKAGNLPFWDGFPLAETISSIFKSLFTYRTMPHFSPMVNGGKVPEEERTIFLL